MVSIKSVIVEDNGMKKVNNSLHIQSMAYDPRTARLEIPRRSYRAERVFMAVILGFALFFFVGGAGVLGYQLWHLGSIYPGVTAGGVEVGGLRPVEAATILQEKLDYPQTGNILLFDDQQSWQFTPSELGLFLDPGATASRAFEVGRQGGIFQRLESLFNTPYYGKAVSPVFIYDQRLAVEKLKTLAKSIDRPMVEASLKIEGTTVSTTAGQVGRHVDISATLALLGDQMKNFQDGAVKLVVVEEKPTFTDLTKPAETARQILSEPLRLTLPEGQSDQAGPWVIEPAELVGMLSMGPQATPQGTEYQVQLKDDALIAYLAQLAPGLQKTAQNARFLFNDETHQLEVIQPAVIGRALNVNDSLNAVREKMKANQHTVPLSFTFTDPVITDNKTGEDLGIRELVHAETSYFYGSSTERVQNIQAAASKFHGVMVAPGETFSMASTMGDVSLDNGYAEAVIIYGGRSIKGVGGGVCQVSTTLFRAAFFTGFPVVERYPHAYRVYYYEKIAGNQLNEKLAGLDATVYVPMVDFKFTNNTPYWLLMETYVVPENASITWKFYSTSDGRTVDWDTTGPVNIVDAPKPAYKENEEFQQGEVRQVDWAADGADVSVTRRVNRNGALLFEDTFNTHYEPWQAIYEYGPGTEGMPPPEE